MLILNSMNYYCISSVKYIIILYLYIKIIDFFFFLIEIKLFICKIEINNSLFYARCISIYIGLYLETLKIIKNGETINTVNSVHNIFRYVCIYILFVFYIFILQVAMFQIKTVSR